MKSEKEIFYRTIPTCRRLSIGQDTPEMASLDLKLGDYIKITVEVIKRV